MINEKLTAKFEALFDKYVPGSGSCETLGGEILRAVGKTCYRYYNDGDLSWEDYGNETVNYCVRFLVSVCETLNDNGQDHARFANACDALYQRMPYSDSPASYEAKLTELVASALDFIEVFGLCEKPNTLGDMLDYYDPAEDNEPDPDEEDEFDYDEWERERWGETDDDE